MNTDFRLIFTDNVCIYAGILVVQPFPFALHNSTCRFSILHQSVVGMLSCICAHKPVTIQHVKIHLFFLFQQNHGAALGKLQKDVCQVPPKDGGTA
jgi:hypothetical protein